MAEHKEHVEEELDLEEDFLQQMQNVQIADDEPVSLVEKVKVYHEMLKAKYNLQNRYPAQVPGELVVPTSNKVEQNVLFVLLGPSKDTYASSSENIANWNPFLKINGAYTKSLTELNNAIKTHNPNFGLEDFFLIDAYPRLYWNGSTTPSAADYYSHFKYGVDYVKYVISIVKPKFVLSFGSQSAFVVEAAFKSIVPLRSNFGTNSRYTHSVCKEVMTSADSTVYYCKHPSSRGIDKFDLVKTAIDDIAQTLN